MNHAKEKSKIAFDKQAATYDHDIKGQHARNLYPALMDKLSHLSFDIFLDLGCGTGAVLQALLNEDADKKAYGIDLSKNMIKQAESKLSGSATLVVGDSDNLPFENNFFDIVYCNDSFHHYPAPKIVLLEAYRVLKPGGTIIICDCWQPLPARTIMNAFMKYGNEGDVKIYSKKEICSLLSLDFQNITWEKVNGTSFIAYGTK